MYRHRRSVRLALLLSAALTVVPGWAGPQRDSLAAEFANPPSSARPRVWWHWMNGNITKDGIRKDLEWMSRVGIGGVQNFDASMMTPKIVAKRIAYMTPEWKDAFRYAVETAGRLGLEFAIAGSPGWSESGGPWVLPENAMKKYVWSETTLTGGTRFRGTLPQPPSVTGPYQGLPVVASVTAAFAEKPAAPPPTYYRDAAVFAYRLAEKSDPAPFTARTGDGQVIDTKAISDPASPGVTVASRVANAPNAVIIEYKKPQTIRSATVFLPGSAAQFTGGSLTPSLEAEVSAGTWRKVADIEAAQVPTTVGFAPVTARRFRLVLNPARPKAEMANLDAFIPGVATLSFSMPAPKTVKIAQLQLSAEPRINRFETKAGFSIPNDYYGLDQAAATDGAAVAPSDVVDLTGKVMADGRLDWTPPAGQWRIVRLGYSLVGTTNHPATAEATGLEVDEYDGTAVRSYAETYLGMYEKVTGPDLIGKRGLHAQINDSTEVGPSNWTPAMLEQFQRLRGYDPRPWLPALTGVVVGSRAESNAFLYDFRRTLADLVASEHYGTIAAIVRDHHMIEYGEALEGSRPSLGDDMTMRSHADVPMSALWAYDPAKGPNPVYLADMKGAASVAHVYGQNIAAAESMTAFMDPWAFAPSDLKRYIDLEFASGINRPVIHTSVHQPLDNKVPGLALMIFGQHFTRHESWAELAKPWVDYMSRSAHLLQQGRNVADVAYFYGEEAPLVALYQTAMPADAPTHYAYDFVNAAVLKDQISVAGRDIVSRGGARYKAIYLGGSSRQMTLTVLRRLAELAEAGATIVGPAPVGSPALGDDKAAYAEIVKRLWSGTAVTAIGKGRVYDGTSIEAALKTDGAAPDFVCEGCDADSQLLFVHRGLEDGDIYFVNNRKAREEKVKLHFRVTGKAPQLWHADTGTFSPASYRIDGGETVVPLDMAPEDAVFVVFRTPAKRPVRTVAAATWRPIVELNGGWDLSFQSDRGAPAQTHFDKLQSLTERRDDGIKYFSGRVTYRTTFALPNMVKTNSPLRIDLGRVGDIAEVTVNGRKMGYAWKAPYQVDIGKAVKAGRNTLEITVADRWINRLIGDAQPNAKKITFSSMPTFKPDAPLRPSGLIGPVTVSIGTPSR